MSETLIPIHLIESNPYQPRKQEDPQAVEELALDILHHATPEFDGLMQVPTVRAVKGHYQLAFGHTRKAAFAYLVESGQSRYEEMRVNVRELDDVQMFELAVAENIKRRDLNPIEQADAMRRYMDEFGKTSREAGEFFGVAEETVRQKVRLLKLPEPVQAKMRQGEINENTARSLLSMQKVASDEVVASTIKKIEQRKGESLPEEVIEQVIDRLDNVVELWSRDGKPQAGDGWPLDMKKFPNQLLPKMTEEMVGAYESQIEHLIDPPACTSCPFYTKVRGTHYCGLKVCHDRKQIAWGAHLLERATKNLGIPAYDKAQDGRFVILASYEGKHKQLFRDRHADLRLLLKSDLADRYASQWGFDGLDSHYVLVVATGKAMDKLNVSDGNKSRGGKKTEKEKAEMRMMKVYRARRKELLWAFTDVAKVMLKDVPVKALEQIQRWKFVGVDERIPDEWLRGKRESAQTIADFERRELVWCLIEDVCSHYRRQSMSDILKKLDKYASDWGVKVPASLKKLAEQIDAEINAAAKPKESR